MPVRACGASRVAGATYIVCPLSAKGMPIEHFLIDPPLMQDWKDMGITEVGMKALKDGNGVTHLFDVVGSNNYPNVADFVEEVRRYGLSRRISGRFKFESLSVKSRIFLLHKRAQINNASEYHRIGRCVKDLPEHKASGPMCARLWWEDVEGGTLNDAEERAVVRAMPSFEYTAYQRPDNVKPQYALAAFASFPIIGIEVINDIHNGGHTKAVESARRSNLTVNLVDE